jgi:hypothetical protein
VAGTGAPVGATISHYGTTTSHDCTFESAHHIDEVPGGDVLALTNTVDPDCLLYARVRFEYADYTRTYETNHYSIAKPATASGFKSSLHSSRAEDGTLVSRRLSAF